MRGYFCTGGQTDGEVWTPPGEQSARLGDKNQEHCTVYNMMRLAEALLMWTGDVSYADYWERNLYNGILTQQHPSTGMISYFLPLQAGGSEKWGTPTEDFWCCHGTLVQAHSAHGSSAFLEDDGGLVINQYIPSEVKFTFNGTNVKATQSVDSQLESIRRPESMMMDIQLAADEPIEMVVKVRIPWWTNEAAFIIVNGQKVAAKLSPSSYFEIKKVWHQDKIQVMLPKFLYTCALPDNPDMVAFMGGPVVLAGLCVEERVLKGDRNNPDMLIIPDNEREWGYWKGGYRTKGMDFGFRLVPLYEICDEKYQVYFQVVKI